MRQDEQRRAQLGAFLRSRRAMVQPGDVGLEAGPRRRTPGLRREEVAALAGVGLSWYTWLEQGRDVRPSPEVLDAVSGALRMDPAERAYLFHLARVESPLPGDDWPRSAPDELAALVEALNPNPAYLLGPRLDVLAWNRAAAAVIHDFGAVAPKRRNLLWLLFTDEDLHRRRPGWRSAARRNLARFRAAYGRHPGDPDFARLAEDLAGASEEFRAWWDEHEVLQEQLGHKTVPDASGQRLRLHHAQTIPAGHPELLLTIYAPADEASRAALADFA